MDKGEGCNEAKKNINKNTVFLSCHIKCGEPSMAVRKGYDDVAFGCCAASAHTLSGSRRVGEPVSRILDES